MSLLLTFMELDKLYESTMSRQDLITHIKASGRNYNFETKSTAQLFRIWERIQNEDRNADSYEHSSVSRETCTACGTLLNDGGTCPICDDGEEHLLEWRDTSGNSVTMTSNSTALSQPVPQNSVATQAPQGTTGPSAKNIVTIVYDTTKHKLRAVADDGVHGYANVAFPNNLRTRDGQQYEVGSLVWNGKNYRVSGNIKPI
jgi:hypothetical protein